MNNCALQYLLLKLSSKNCLVLVRALGYVFMRADKALAAKLPIADMLQSELRGVHALLRGEQRATNDIKDIGFVQV